MRILNTYIVQYKGVLMQLVETTGSVNENGYGKYFTIARDFKILPLNQDIAASLIYK